MPISSPPQTYLLDPTGTSGMPVGPDVCIGKIVKCVCVCVWWRNMTMKGEEGRERRRMWQWAMQAIHRYGHLHSSYHPSSLFLSTHLYFSPLPPLLCTPYKYKNNDMMRLLSLTSHLYHLPLSLSWSSWRCTSTCGVRSKGKHIGEGSSLLRRYARTCHYWYSISKFMKI